MSEDSSSSSDSDFDHHHKRKISKLKDSSDDDDDGDHSSEFEIITKKKRKLVKLEDSPAYSSSGSEIIASSSSTTTSRMRFRRKPIIDDSDSDSCSSFEIRRKSNRLPRILSDVESDSSSSFIINPTRRRARVSSDGDDDNSDRQCYNSSSSSLWNSDDGENSNKPIEKPVDFDSDSSDGQTEKCPICLISLNKNQEIGTPESCEHMFCAECIQEWSKNMNTCPVDRQPYNLISIRKTMHNSVYREIEIVPPVQHDDHLEANQQLRQDIDFEALFEDATFCEICGRCDREERMLLCDGCDLGYHLECLTPPLDEIPGGAWYCEYCETDVGFQPIRTQHGIGTNRLAPRTRHSERIRRRIQNIRNSAQLVNTPTEEPTNQANRPPAVTSTTINNRNNPQTRRGAVVKKKRRKKQQRYRYKTTYQIDETTGETIVVKERIKRRRKRTKKRRRNQPKQPKTVKQRLTSHLGICAPRTVPQILPDMRVQTTNTNSIGSQRYQAGIPALDLFGQRQQFDYIAQSDDDDDDDDDGGGHDFSNTAGGANILIRRPPNRNDILAFRRRNRVKNCIPIPNQVSSTTTDLLENILDIQTKFHAKTTKFILDKNGRFTIENNVNFNDYNRAIRQRTASCSNNNNSNNNRNNDSLPSSSSRRDDNYQNNTNNSQPTSTVDTSNTAMTSSSNDDHTQDYSQRNLATNLEENRKDKRTKNQDRSENDSESEIDIYSDIETVSTSKVDDCDIKQQSPIPLVQHNQNDDDDDDDEDSEPDMIIDTEKPTAESEENTKEETTVTSTVDNNNSDSITINTITSLAHSTSEIQSEAVQSSNLFTEKDDVDDDDDTDSDGCPNFSIYSKESQNLAKNIDISIPTDDHQQEQTNQVGEISSSPAVERIEISPISNNQAAVATQKPIKSGLYSDSEDETIVKKTVNSPFVINDIRTMTEDISEEERSYTPCLDEREPIVQGIEGLDTEMISDEEDRNDFDENTTTAATATTTNDLKIEQQDGDALEINAKESELDFTTRPEDCEEGEIVDKTKTKKSEETKKVTETEKESKPENHDDKHHHHHHRETNGDKENDNQNNKESVFKKLSKSNKERNYRDKDKERSRSRSKDRKNKNDKKDRRKDKRKEIERYNVRAIVAERPRRLKDRFGRDLRCTLSRSKSRSVSKKRSPSRTKRSPSKPRRSLSHNRKSPSRNHGSPSNREWQRKKQRGRSRTRRSPRTQSRSHSSERKQRSVSKTKKRKRSSSSHDDRPPRRRKSRDRSKTNNKKKGRSRSRQRSRSITPKRRKDWSRRHSREWTPSLSRSPEPTTTGRHLTPSWTPPRLLDNNPVKPHNLTVILTNDSNKKKKEKKNKKLEKKTKENDKQKKKKQQQQRGDRTPPPSKEVFASGDNILVSVSFNKENETRDVSTKKKKEQQPEVEIVKKIKKDKRPKVRPIKKRDLSGVKPVAIIDLERSPFKELTPSPKDIIVLSDSDNETTIQKNICDSSSQPEVVSPEHCCGPKTPPEPQVKFTLAAKIPQLRNISNPLHEPDDIEEEEEEEEETGIGDNQQQQQQQQLQQQQNDGLHKGPNTPPEPPNSPPSSPDAYDPFEPTKSRSPTPQPLQNKQSCNNIDDNLLDTRSSINEDMDKSENSLPQTPGGLQSHTPPLLDVQPADSQSGIHATTTTIDTNLLKSPESLQQIQPTNFSITTTKSNNLQTIPFSSVSTSIITSTPINTNQPPRINILNTTIPTTTPPTITTLSNRNVSSNTVRLSPIKISPNKQNQSVVATTTTTTTTSSTTTTTSSSSSSTTTTTTTRKSNSNRNNETTNDNNINFDSPYSPGSSDYEGLFEPPAESPVKTKPPTNSNNNNNNNNNNNSGNNGNKTVKSPAKLQNAFDALFGSPVNKMKPKTNEKSSSKFNNNNNNSSSGNNKRIQQQQQQQQQSLPPPSSSSAIGSSKQVGIKFDEDSLKILDELPSSAVEMQVKDKFLKKLNRQERVVEEVKLVLKPHYNKKHINKDEYKDILRRAVPKICHNKSGEINPTKIKNLVEAYVKKIRHSKKVTSSSSVNPQKA